MPTTAQPGTAAGWSAEGQRQPRRTL